MPSPSIARASLMNVPMTRLVKKPRLSLTTMGVLRICAAMSRALANVTSEVFAPTIISSNGIFSTGEKKCRPIKFSRFRTPAASSVMGKVDVLEPSTAP